MRAARGRKGWLGHIPLPSSPPPARKPPPVAVATPTIDQKLRQKSAKGATIDQKLRQKSVHDAKSLQLFSKERVPTAKPPTSSSQRDYGPAFSQRAPEASPSTSVDVQRNWLQRTMDELSPAKAPAAAPAPAPRSARRKEPSPRSHQR